jgi:hypothetical protein
MNNPDDTGNNQQPLLQLLQNFHHLHVHHKHPLGYDIRNMCSFIGRGSITLPVEGLQRG